MVVCVHGIGQQGLGEQSLLASWQPALQDGLTRHTAASRPDGVAVADRASSPDVDMAFYGDLFRPAGSYLAVGDPVLGPGDVQPGLEQELLAAWWVAAAEVDERVAGPDADTLVSVPGWVQRALTQLSNSRFFAGVALRSMVFDLKQVARYLTDPVLRVAARERVVRLIGADTRVVVAHSLGSVVAYEALCSLPRHGVRALVTLGSPLGIANLVFDRLEPSPVAGRGVWPGDDNVVWTNIADAGDVVALVKDLRPRFGERVRNAVVHNGAKAHAVVPYLTDQLTGTAIAEGLA
ncbi:GPI inositol-deacylase [Nocardia sp. NRRL S-836]|uniref:GPI inositol-deacylase n=1 Tax=Nocardia sp. NRRL S-836 TaxID=1519492 RepID=UPI0006C1C290|nr:GPI inositol-deacylase [Nocardia sp. NRRL S-836]KOV87629.1 mucin [Nocardia sp. NRRL S-836]